MSLTEFQKLKEEYLEVMEKLLPRPLHTEIMKNLKTTQVGEAIVDASVQFARNVQAEALNRCGACQEPGTDRRCQCWNDE